MLNLDPAKLLVIGMVALIVLGPERLPRAARQLAGVWRELNRLRDQVTDEVKSAFPLDELPRIPKVSSAISGTMARMTRPIDRPGASGTATDSESSGDRAPEGLSAPVGARQRPQVVVHPSLGDFAFVPDDPSMN